MNEEQLRERLRSAADQHQTAIVVEEDVQRGRRGLARRRRAAVGGSLATVAVLSAVTLTANQLMDDPPSLGQGANIATQPSGAPGAGADPGKTAAAPPAGEETKSAGPGERSFSIEDTKPWRNGLHALAIQHLDPSEKHINYRTNSLQGGEGDDGSISMGIKLGWKESGDEGEGLVAISVASKGSPGLLDPCNQYGPCETTTLPGHDAFKLSGDPDSGAGYVVRVTQADGEQVQIVVDPVFGNNTTVPTGAPLPSLEQVLDLAEDDNLSLP